MPSVPPYRDPAAAPIPAPVPPASCRGLHHQHCYCWSCQDRQSTVPPAVSLPPARAPRRAPTGPSSRFPLPEPFSALSTCSGTRARGVSQPYYALSPPPPAPPLYSGSVSRLRRAPTGPSLFSSPQPFLLPAPAPSFNSGSVSHLLRKTIPYGGRSENERLLPR